MMVVSLTAGLIWSSHFDIALQGYVAGNLAGIHVFALAVLYSSFHVGVDLY